MHSKFTLSPWFNSSLFKKSFHLIKKTKNHTPAYTHPIRGAKKSYILQQYQSVNVCLLRTILSYRSSVITTGNLSNFGINVRWQALFHPGIYGSITLVPLGDHCCPSPRRHSWWHYLSGGSAPTATPWPLRPHGMFVTSVHSFVSGL